MKEVLWIVVVLLLSALDWAALHDILKREPDPYGEYGIIVFSIVVFGVMVLVGMRGRRKRLNP